VEEVVQTIERLQQTFEDLTVRGLRTCGPEQLTILSSLHEDLDRIGAAHLAGRLEALINGIKSDDRASARALMRAQASLRVFERLLTLETVEREMTRLQAQFQGDGDSDDGDPDDDEFSDQRSVVLQSGSVPSGAARKGVVQSDDHEEKDADRRNEESRI
jgi:hypothetical protein